MIPSSQLTLSLMASHYVFIVKWRTLIFKDFQSTLKIVVCKRCSHTSNFTHG